MQDTPLDIRNQEIDALRPLSESDLQAGDLIFYICPDGNKSDIADSHVLIYTGDALPYRRFAHAVGIANGMDDIRRTHLSQFDYLVIRPKNSQLATRAAQLATDWSDYFFPFDYAREETARSQEKAFSPTPQYFAPHPTAQTQAHDAFNPWDVIKYAVRANMMPVLPSQFGRGKGLFCSQFITLVYQVAALIEADCITLPNLSTENEHWPANKYADIRLLDPTIPEADKTAYQAYCQAKEKPNPLPPHQTKYHAQFTPAINYWNYKKASAITEFKFNTVLGTGLTISPHTMPTALFNSLHGDTDHWHVVGKILAQKPIPKNFNNIPVEHARLQAFPRRLRAEFRPKQRHYLKPSPPSYKAFACAIGALLSVSLLFL